MSKYLKLTFLKDNSQEIEKVIDHEFRNKPFSNSDVFLPIIENFELLTKGEDVKRVYDLKLSTKEISYDFLPGDTIGILARNNAVEIEKLLLRLNLESHGEKRYKLEVLKDTVKKKPTLPKHIPHVGVLKDIFTSYIDIRKPPKKLFLKALIPFTTAPEEIEKLQQVCCPKGSKQYSELITGSAQTLLGLLNTFPTCFPPIEVILAHSLPLQPRYFSIASSPLDNVLNITFFVVENNDGTKGVCTGWLEEIITGKDPRGERIPIYFREPNNFRIPRDLSIPLIMVATGTGVAPFKGFLEHRLQSKMAGAKDIGDALLFYGCRYSDRDFLYPKEIEGCLNEGVLLKLYTAFSRDGDKKCYVQDRINENGEAFVDYLLDKDAVVYVCGNMKTMLKGVEEAVVNNLVKYGRCDEATAKRYLSQLIQQNRFIVDSWL